MLVESDKLVLLVIAPDTASLEHIEGVLARHLQRFARQEQLNILWLR
ncbi:hypothetical protein ARTSIC4J27_2076 [Pseudarthrobacter siccitolerans]|uniref:Uncharacterized protein n=1 Tax=Pseudarthrobacter siccitolerans TaxID=861266 RepID=A0A024H313_9MICC|nr:hypothetical protein ARTSIC4J27_2076 [Pseudarthrobacter siccitolerans]